MAALLPTTPGNRASKGSLDGGIAGPRRRIRTDSEECVVQGPAEFGPRTGEDSLVPDRHNSTSTSILWRFGPLVETSGPPRPVRMWYNEVKEACHGLQAARARRRRLRGGN